MESQVVFQAKTQAKIFTIELGPSSQTAPRSPRTRAPAASRDSRGARSTTAATRPEVAI